jgi:hypothetical protein
MKKSPTQLEQAIALVNAGDNAQARTLLVEVLNNDPTNDTAWVWMAVVVDTLDLRRECLQEALKHNPRNKTARRALDKLETQGLVTYNQIEGKSLRKQRWVAHGLPLLLFLLGIVLGVIGWLRYQQELTLQTEGRAIPAGIVRLYQRTGRATGSYAEYAYDIGGKHYTGEARIPYQDWAKLQVGQAIIIRYLPSNPQFSESIYEIASDPWAEFKDGLGFVGVLLLAPIALEFVMALYAYTRKTQKH